MKYLLIIAIPQSKMIQKVSDQVCFGVSGDIWYKCHRGSRSKIETKLFPFERGVKNRETIIK